MVFCRSFPVKTYSRHDSTRVERAARGKVAISAVATISPRRRNRQDELAIEQNAPTTTDEFKTLNGCLDTAIAEAVTEHARLTAESRSTEGSERSGQIAHEARDLLNTAILAYQTLKRGAVAVNGSTGAVLGRSLMGLRDLVDRPFMARSGRTKPLTPWKN